MRAIHFSLIEVARNKERKLELGSRGWGGGEDSAGDDSDDLYRFNFHTGLQEVRGQTNGFKHKPKMLLLKSKDGRQHKSGSIPKHPVSRGRKH